MPSYITERMVRQEYASWLASVEDAGYLGLTADEVREQELALDLAYQCGLDAAWPACE